MTIEELHFEFRRRWDKNSNNHRRYLTDLEVDQLYNNVISDYVDMFGTGKNIKRYDVGFEVTQQMIDMISPLVIGYPEESLLSLSNQNGILIGNLDSLSKPYRHYVTSFLQDKYCGLVDVNIEQHHDLSTIRLDYHRKASKMWKRVPATIRNNKIYLYSDGLFTGVQGLQITYIKDPVEVCLGTYTISPTIENPNPSVIKPQSETDIDPSFHHILVTMAVQEAARIYADQFQLVTQDNKLNDIT